MNKGPQKKGLKETFTKLVKVAALGTALGGVPGDGKAMRLDNFPESQNVTDRRGERPGDAIVDTIVFDPSPISDTAPIDTGEYSGNNDVIVMQNPGKQPWPKMPGEKHVQKKKGSPTNEKLPPQLGW